MMRLALNKRQKYNFHNYGDVLHLVDIFLFIHVAYELFAQSKSVSFTLAE